MSFPYKNVLVVGATSGIGLALAEKLIANGSHVIALGRRQENLETLTKKHGSNKVSTVQFDITDLEAIPSTISSITKAHPNLDCAILNSGIQRSINFTRPESIDLDLVSTEFTTNYLSHIHLTKALLPFLSSRAPAPTALIYVTSGLGLIPMPRCGNYSASKAAMHSLILCMRAQLATSPPYKHLKVIEIVPPMVQTELHDPKNQPDRAGERGRMGMPLDEFTDKTWAQLVEGKDQVIVGMMGESSWTRWEGERQKQFGEMVQRMGNGIVPPNT